MHAPAPVPCTPPPGIPQPGVRDRRAKFNHDAWAYAALKHAELRDTIQPDAVVWPAMPAGHAMHELVARTKEVLEQTGDPPNFAKAGEVIKRRVDVAVAEAQREHRAGNGVGLRWFTPSRMWDAKSFWRALELTPAQAFEQRATQRIGAKSTAPPGTGPPQTPDPPRKIKTLT